MRSPCLRASSPRRRGVGGLPKSPAPSRGCGCAVILGARDGRRATSDSGRGAPCARVGEPLGAGSNTPFLSPVGAGLALHWGPKKATICWAFPVVRAHFMPSRTPAPGVVVDGKYRLAERIGGGGMGDVFRAENVLAGRPVAIKFLLPDLIDNPEAAQRFFEEAQAVNRIRHPNIVDVIDAGIGEAGPYMVMEYLEGESVGAALEVF